MAREALSASSLAVMSGELGCDAESVVEALQEAIEGLLEFIEQRQDVIAGERLTGDDR